MTLEQYLSQYDKTNSTTTATTMKTSRDVDASVATTYVSSSPAIGAATEAQSTLPSPSAELCLERYLTDADRTAVRRAFVVAAAPGVQRAAAFAAVKATGDAVTRLRSGVGPAETEAATAGLTAGSVSMGKARDAMTVTVTWPTDKARTAACSANGHAKSQSPTHSQPENPWPWQREFATVHLPLLPPTVLPLLLSLIYQTPIVNPANSTSTTTTADPFADSVNGVTSLPQAATTAQNVAVSKRYDDSPASFALAAAAMLSTAESVDESSSAASGDSEDVLPVTGREVALASTTLAALLPLALVLDAEVLQPTIAAALLTALSLRSLPTYLASAPFFPGIAPTVIAFARTHAEPLLASAAVERFPPRLMRALLEDDALAAPELACFKALMRWAGAQQLRAAVSAHAAGP